MPLSCSRVTCCFQPFCGREFRNESIIAISSAIRVNIRIKFKVIIENNWNMHFMYTFMNNTKFEIYVIPSMEAFHNYDTM